MKFLMLTLARLRARQRRLRQLLIWQRNVGPLRQPRRWNDVASTTSNRNKSVHCKACPMWL